MVLLPSYRMAWYILEVDTSFSGPPQSATRGWQSLLKGVEVTDLSSASRDTFGICRQVPPLSLNDLHTRGFACNRIATAQRVSVYLELWTRSGGLFLTLVSMQGYVTLGIATPISQNTGAKWNEIRPVGTQAAPETAP